MTNTGRSKAVYPLVRSVSNARIKKNLTTWLSFDVIYLITPFLLNCKLWVLLT